MKRHAILLIIPYFGHWPEWMPLFIHSIRLNPEIDFLFYTDCDTEILNAPNVRFKKVSFDEYIRFVNRKLPFQFSPENAYKLCDLRPLFGEIHKEDCADYAFYGWCDTDLLFGNLRAFYTPDILDRYDVISSHAVRISGHLAIFRNNKRNRQRYEKIYRWREALAEREFVGIDEHGLTNAYTWTIFDKINAKFGLAIDNFITRSVKKRQIKRLYLVEKYTTPFTRIPWLDGTIDSMQPDTWYFKNGRIWNDRDKATDFPYLHLMNFKSARWRHDKTPAPWEGKSSIYKVNEHMLNELIRISPSGIETIDNWSESKKMTPTMQSQKGSNE